MPTDPPVLDNRPLTVADVHQFSAPNQMLATKLAAHLDGDWTVGHDDGTLRALLTGPDGESLVVYATERRGEWEAVVRGQRPPQIPDGYALAFHWNGLDLPLETAPADMARQIEADLLPSYRIALTDVRAKIAYDETDKARRQEAAEVLAARLGPEWCVRERPVILSYVPRSHFIVERNVQQKQIFGEFFFQHGRGGTGVNLCNVSTDTLDTIVEAVIKHQENDPHRRKRWPKRLKRALLLMHQEGYSIDRIGPIHRNLFGPYIFKMDSRVGVGYPVVAYLRERPDAVEQVIKLLDHEPEGT